MLRAARQRAEQEAAARDRRRIYIAYGFAAVLAALVVAGVIMAISSSSGGDGDEGTTLADAGENVNPTYGVLPDGIEVDERQGTAPPPLSNGDLDGAARVAGCELRTDLLEEGNTHFADLDKVPDYGTAPPTSGDHYAANEAGAGALADGAFLQTPPLSRAVHSLEHGRVEIQYDPRLGEEEQLALKGVFDEAPPGVILFPNKEMPYEVAATAWTQLVGCDSFNSPETLDVLRTFRDSYVGRGPEPVPYQ